MKPTGDPKIDPDPAVLDRIRAEYQRRRQHSAYSSLYSPYNPAYLFEQQNRQRLELRALRRHGLTPPFANRRILDFGCGAGGTLIEYLGITRDPGCLFGIDLLPDRLREAHGLHPGLSLAAANGQAAPFPPASFDLILQRTVFSSVLDEELRASMAREMLRLLRPGGLILWYDFWLNPTNPQTRGIRAPEISRLFPGCRINLHRLTLAPPIARRLVPISWGLASILEGLKVLNTHLLAVITRLS